MFLLKNQDSNTRQFVKIATGSTMGNVYNVIYIEEGNDKADAWENIDQIRNNYSFRDRLDDVAKWSKNIKAFLEQSSFALQLEVNESNLPISNRSRCN